MNTIRYYTKILKKLNFNNLKNTVADVSKTTGKPEFMIFNDMIFCAIKYGAAFSDYRLFKFYELNSDKRKTFLTRGINNRIIQNLNDKSYFDEFSNKYKFLLRFANFAKREFMEINSKNYDDFSEFTNNKSYIIAKCEYGSCGKEVEKINLSKTSGKPLFNRLLAENKILIEECVKQHKILSDIYPYSVNTVRVLTLNGKAILAFIRIGTNNSSVDNLNSGGITSPINLESGEIIGPACDKNNICYNCHPQTKAQISGVKLPFWKDIISISEEAAKIIPQVKYIGWDIAICDDKILIIEANEYPGYDIMQMPPHLKNNEGLLSLFSEYI